MNKGKSFSCDYYVLCDHTHSHLRLRVSPRVLNLVSIMLTQVTHFFFKTINVTHAMLSEKNLNKPSFFLFL